MINQLQLLLPLAWRNLWRNPRRTCITLLVVSVGLWSILIFSVMLRAWSVSSRDATVNLLIGQVQVHSSHFLNDPTATQRIVDVETIQTALQAKYHVKSMASRLRFAVIIQSEYKTLPVTLAGVSPHQERSQSVLPQQISTGRYLNDSDDAGILVGRNLAKRLKTRIGKRVIVLTQDVHGKLAERAFVVIGLFAAPQQIEDDMVFTGLHTAQSMTGAEQGITEIAFNAGTDSLLPELLAELHRDFPALDIQSWQTLSPLAYAAANMFSQFVGMWLGVMFILMALGIVNTQLMAVFERTREFGLLHALGMRPHSVLLEVALESMILIGIGVLVGITLTMMTVQLFPHGLNLGLLSRGADLLGGGHILYPRIDTREMIIISVSIWAMGVTATLWPAYRASRVSPVVAMSHA